MSRKINVKFTDNNGKLNQFTLEYTRSSIAIMERNGFDREKAFSNPSTNLPVMFAGAFIANHKHLKSEIIDTLFKAFPNKEDLFEKLAGMYTDGINTLFDTDTSLGNVEWNSEE